MSSKPTAFRMLTTWIAASLWFAGSGSKAWAQEAVRSGGTVRMEVIEDDAAEEAEPLPQADSATSALRLVLNGEVYESKYRTKIPTLRQAYHAACGFERTLHRRSVCRQWPSIGRSFEAAAKVFGIPAPALVCVMKAESNFVPGLTSDVGASGLMQFMPGTARRFEHLMRRTPFYQERWRAYRKSGGSDRSVEAFTGWNIRSDRASAADVQIFAAAMYIHDSMRGAEAVIRRSLGPPPEPNGLALKRLMHYWLVSYNAGGLYGQQFLRRAQRSEADAYRGLPSETQIYIKKFNACVGNAVRMKP